MADQDRLITPRLGLIGLDVADVPFGYAERVEFSDVMRANNALLDLMALSAVPSSAPLSSSIFVDPSGSDSNDGLTSATPLRLIQSAIDRVPFFTSGRVLIRLAPGTYDETLTIYKIFQPVRNSDGNTWGAIMFSGSQQDSVLSQGALTGTFDADFSTLSSSHWAKFTGAGWATDALRGKFIQVTSGPRNGWKFPVASNTSEVLSMGGITDFSGSSSDDFRSKTFKIVQPAVTIQTNSANTDTIVVNGASATNQQQANISAILDPLLLSTLDGVFMQDIAVIQSSTTPGLQSTIRARAANVQGRFCLFKRTGPTTGGSAIHATVTFGSYGSLAHAYHFRGCSFWDDCNTGVNTAVLLNRGQLLLAGCTVMTNLFGISISNGTLTVNGMYVKMTGTPLANTPNALSLFERSLFTSTSGGWYLEGFNKTGSGIQYSSTYGAVSNLFTQALSIYTKTSLITNFSSGIFAFRNADIDFRRVNIIGNATAVQFLSGKMAKFIANGAENHIENNDEGIKFAASSSASPNVYSIFWNKSATFANNGSGTKDFSNDGGTTWYTVAQLQALPNRQIQDTLLNIIKTD